MANKKIVTRKVLYDLVWSNPLTTLSKEYAYSNNDIRKICIKYDIPLPKSGHWSKVKFNKKVKIEKLPNADNSTKIELDIRKKGQPYTNHPNSEMSKLKRQIEENKELSLNVPDRLSNPDNLIIQARKDLKNKKPSDWGTSQGLISTSKDIICIEVSKPNISRALLIMDTLIKLIKRRGHGIKVDDGTFVIINNEELKIRLREFVKRIKNEDSSWERFKYVPSGELSIRLEDTYPEKMWRDSKKTNLETKLSNILTTLELKAKQKREQRIQREFQQANWKKQRKKEEEYRNKKESEFNKIKQLFNTASRWHKSASIRNYIKEFHEFSFKNNTLDEEKKQWIKWANEMVDWYDPFIEKEVKLLEDVDKDTLEVKRKSSMYLHL